MKKSNNCVFNFVLNCYLLDGKCNGRPLMAAIVVTVGDESFDGVFDTEGLAAVIFTGLQSNGAGRVAGERKGKRVSDVLAELLDQFILDGCQLLFNLVLRGRYHLLFGKHQFFAELDSHNLIFLSSISVGSRDLDKL